MLQELPEPKVDPELLSFVEAGSMQSIPNGQLITLLEYAMLPDGGESAIDDFSVKLLEVMGYCTRHRVTRTRVDLELIICNQYRHAKTDVCLVDGISVRNEILLLLQEDKMLGNKPVRARAQLIAEIVAGFNQNNLRRIASALPPLVEKVSYVLISISLKHLTFVLLR